MEEIDGRIKDPVTDLYLSMLPEEMAAPTAVHSTTVLLGLLFTYFSIQNQDNGLERRNDRVETLVRECKLPSTNGHAVIRVYVVEVHS